MKRFRYAIADPKPGATVALWQTDVDGKQLYDSGCRDCHGDLHTGKGRLEPRATILPEEAVEFYNTMFPGVKHRTIVTEKIRHGGFFGLGGQMAPYGAELLTDQQLIDIYAYVGF